MVERTLYNVSIMVVIADLDFCTKEMRSLHAIAQLKTWSFVCWQRECSLSLEDLADICQLFDDAGPKFWRRSSACAFDSRGLLALIGEGRLVNS